MARFPLQTRVEPEERDQFEDWRREQKPVIPSRSDALRELMLLGLRVSTQRRKPKAATAESAA